MSTAEHNQQFFTTFEEALNDMREYILRVEKGCEQITLAFQSGNTSKAIEMMVQVVEGFSFLLKLAESAERLFKLDLHTLFLDDNISVLSFVIDLNKTCGEIMQAAEAKDYSLVGDLIEYELPLKTGQAQKMLDIFRQKLADGKGV